MAGNFGQDGWQYAASNFHVFEIEWTKEKITWLVDGKAYHTVEIADDAMNEFHAKQYILLNVAVGGEHAGRRDETTPFPAQMYVDRSAYRSVGVYREK